MFEPKPLASLSSSLLARKGDARPAIRRAYIPLTAVAPLPVSLQKEAVQDDPPLVRQQQERIARTFSAPVEKAGSKPRKAKAAFTLRLDAERHLRLRLASVVGRRSAQRIVTEALDAFLDGQPGLDALVAQARHSAPDS